MYNFNMVKYYFHIIDNEFNSEYDYEGYFLTHDEATTFIEDNKKSGNIITILSPYYEWVNANDIPHDIKGWFKEIPQNIWFGIKEG